MTKPPSHLVEAWVIRVRQQMKAQSIRAKATIMFDSGDAILRVRAEYYRNLAARLERLSDKEFVRLVHLEFKHRCEITRDSSIHHGEAGISSSGAWKITAWKPYLRDDAEEWTFTKSMKLPVKMPHTFESVLARAKATKK